MGAVVGQFDLSAQIQGSRYWMTRLAFAVADLYPEIGWRGQERTMMK